MSILLLLWPEDDEHYQELRNPKISSESLPLTRKEINDLAMLESWFVDQTLKPIPQNTLVEFAKKLEARGEHIAWGSFAYTEDENG